MNLRKGKWGKQGKRLDGDLIDRLIEKAMDVSKIEKDLNLLFGHLLLIVWFMKIWLKRTHLNKRFF